jgi:sialate O-acetylesterase
MKHPFLLPLAATAALAAFPALADVKLPMVFADHAVLQRDKPIVVWGWAEPGEEVAVSFADASAEAVADANGEWQVSLPSLPASKEGRAMTVKGQNEIVLEDLLVGDVWICSGQSNMEMNMGGVSDRAVAVEESKGVPFIRHMKIVGEGVSGPTRDTVGTKWQVCSPSSLNGFTATGYFFAYELATALDIPIGLVNNSWSGQKIEPFTSPEAFYAEPGLEAIADAVRGLDPATDAGKAANEKALSAFRAWLAGAEEAVAAGQRPTPSPKMPMVSSHNWPCSAYFNRVHPITRFAVKGAIWYQGCSNGGDGDIYVHKMHALIDGWRKAWGYDFPFYFVQLANHQNATDDPAGGNGWARLRDAQRKSLAIPDTGMAVAIDIGEARDIHPRNKRDVGRRLSLWALAKTYGHDDLVYSGPLFKEVVPEEGRIRVLFEDFSVGSGLMAGVKNGTNPAEEDPEGVIKGFAIAGEDRQWAWADAAIDGDAIVLASPDVPSPVAVRYAFRQNPEGRCNLYNREGLPASPFRSDSW